MSPGFNILPENITLETQKGWLKYLHLIFQFVKGKNGRAFSYPSIWMQPLQDFDSPYARARNNELNNGN